jgi:hypothetical protein
MDKGISALEALPLDAACLTMSFLCFSDLQNMRNCARSLQNVANKTRHLFMDETCAAILPRVVDAVRACKRPPVRRDFGTQQLQTVRLDKRALGNLLHCFTNLRELHLAGLAPIEDSLLGMINHAPSASAIHSLTLQGASLTYWAKALTLPQLQSLRILGGSIRGSLDLLFGKATKLKLLSIAQCSSLRDDQLRMILGRLDPTLTDLSLHQCLRVRRPTIELTRLERLSFMGCFALTENPSFFVPLFAS